MQALKKYIEKYTTVADNDWDIISAGFSKKTFQKEAMLLEEGKICRHFYFLESGLLRYFITKDGKEITKFFTDAPYCFTSQVSFTKGQPAAENIRAIENSIVWQITLEQANLLLELPSWNVFIRKLIQEVQFFTEDILQEIQTETAQRRYLKMLESNHDLVQRIPLKYLASYFGIAPQSLSRIRKEISATGKKLT